MRIRRLALLTGVVAAVVAAVKIKKSMEVDAGASDDDTFGSNSAASPGSTSAERHGS